MIPSPLGSTPFSVKDILNLEHHQIACSTEKDNSRIEFSDIARPNYFGRMFGHPPSGSVALSHLSLNEGAPHAHYKSNKYGGVYASNMIEQTSPGNDIMNLGQASNNKPDQSWMSFDNMADTDSTSKSPHDETTETSGHKIDLHETSSIQAAASTLIDFSQHLHNQTFTNSEKQASHASVLTGFYSPSDCYESGYNNTRMKEVQYEETEAYNISHEVPEIYDKLSESEILCVSPASEEKRITTLQPTMQTTCDSKRFHSLSRCDDAVRRESTYQSRLTSLEKRAPEFQLNNFPHLSESSATVNNAGATTDDMVKFASCTKRSPVNTRQQTSFNPDINAHVEEQELLSEDVNNHVTGTLFFVVYNSIKIAL